MTKTFHFLNGMPRSGSTLLANILNQNPRFAATPTSGLCQLLLGVNQAWNQIPELRASATPPDKVSTLRAMIHGFHEGISRPVVFSKSRGWVCAFELMQSLLGYRPKILITIRDVPSILSSCEKLFRREVSNPSSTAKFSPNMETLEGRLAFWTAPDQIVGSAYNRIRDCAMRGNGDSLHFIEFDKLCAKPKAILKGVYEFLGEEYFEHDFDQIEQSTYEKDSEHGFVDLHTIRPKLQPVKKDYREVLGDAVKPYLGFTYDFIT